MSTVEMTALICPQCGGALPKQARWRFVACPFCGVKVTKGTDAVQAEHFHESWKSYQEFLDSIPDLLVIGKNRFRILAPLGGGERADVFFGERLGLVPERVIIKLSRDSKTGGIAEKEDGILRSLQKMNTPTSAYFSQRLPESICCGRLENPEWNQREAIVFRAKSGYWGSLSDVIEHQKNGIDPRHSVWIWRRILDTLGYVHEQGWIHGSVNPDHLLIQPRDHGILLIGWRKAGKSSQKGKDLRQAAHSIKALLSDPDHPDKTISNIPAPLLSLIDRASEDESWCEKMGAMGIDEELRAVAEHVFGPPQFIPFYPNSK